jgi:hypothetical protein
MTNYGGQKWSLQRIRSGIHISPLSLHRLILCSNDTGEELPEIFHEEAAHLKADVRSKAQSLILREKEATLISRNLKNAQEKITKINQELTQMRENLVQKDLKLAEQSLFLSRCDSHILQLKQGQKP